MAKTHPITGYIAQIIDIRKTNIENDFKEVFAQFQSCNILINMIVLASTIAAFVAALLIFSFKIANASGNYTSCS